MSLYNNLFGENENSDVLLGVIGLNKAFFQRYRDIELIKDGTEIRVTTRCGGLNRKDYHKVYDKLKGNELYIYDEDDSFDSTYSYIYFKIPDKYKDMCQSIKPETEPKNVTEKFKEECEKLQNDDPEAISRAKVLMNQIMGAIDNSNGDGPTIINI